MGAFLAEALEDLVRHALGDNDDLPLDVDVRIVVMATIGRRNAVSDEDELAGHLRFQYARIGPHDHAFALSVVFPVQGEAVELGIRGDVLHRHVGEIGSVVAGGFQAEKPHLGGDIVGGDLVAVRSRVPTRQIVRCQEADVGLDVLGADIRHERGRGIVRAGLGLATHQRQASDRRHQVFHHDLPQTDDVRPDYRPGTRRHNVGRHTVMRL